MQSDKDEVHDLNKRVQRSFADVENGFEEVLNKIQEALESIVSESGKLEGSGDNFAEQFGSKAGSLASDIKRPDKIGLRDIDTYIDALDNFQKEIMYYGAKWVRRIGFKRKIKITRIEDDRKRVQNLTQDLKDMFSNYKSELKRWQRAENIVDKISKLKAELSAKRDALDDTVKNMKKTRRMIEEHEEVIRSLGQKEDLIKVEKFKEDERTFEERVKRELRYLEKPVFKTLKLAERGSVDYDLQKAIQLGRFIDDPRDMLLNIVDEKILEEALVYLRELLKERKLNLKSSRNRKAIEAISSILKEDKIKKYMEKFNDFVEKDRRLQDLGTIEKKTELERAKKELQKKREGLDNAIKTKKKKDEDVKVCEEKIVEYNSKLEGLIR